MQKSRTPGAYRHSSLTDRTQRLRKSVQVRAAWRAGGENRTELRASISIRGHGPALRPGYRECAQETADPGAVGAIWRCRCGRCMERVSREPLMIRQSK